ncbi:hypothetical protein BACCIP111883_02046 [Sutcliffiella rhizosphaerae]|uniref:DUF3951 domain-containing protein n=2 Tax=Sutcliffiella rhizosphaerae TaxID=2880967 RepID=A0ABM8YMQ7_9BACI|nr:hypothetical protein BACCIP111883_02046 [Sutcliffiella rhizosphaerae]
MGAFLTIAVVLIGVYAVIKAVRKRKLPSNNYTPFDDITNGKVDKDN